MPEAKEENHELETSLGIIVRHLMKRQEDKQKGEEGRGEICPDFS